MLKKGLFQVSENRLVAKAVYRMGLCGDTSAVTAPGQFINILLDGCYLRRPISVCDYSEGQITIIYKVVGKGTEALSRIGCGESLDVLSGLGNGFDTAKSGPRPLVIGGGVGVPPMYLLTKMLVEQGKKPVVLLGFNTAADVFYEEEFQKTGAEVLLATADGSAGNQGFVTDLLEKAGNYIYFYTCGPLPMLKAVYDRTVTGGQLSFEERMGCGFGACMGCSCKTKYGNKRICKDGPVLKKEEVIW